ncbi:hypothetical protein [Polyangium jinanense]|nr:hypothetical protein [Polyangium jinanense]
MRPVVLPFGRQGTVHEGEDERKAGSRAPNGSALCEIAKRDRLGG